MALREAPPAGLNPPGVRLRNKTNAVAKVSLAVPAGDELEVSETVAAQLGGQFEPIETGAPLPASPVMEEAGGGGARLRSGRRKD